MEIIVDGRKLYYEMKGDGECVLFLHGWGGSTVSFEGTAKKLSLNYMTLSVDFAGFGNCPSPAFIYSLDNYVDDVEKIIEHCGIKSLVIIGHSFGGRVAIALAVKRPELIKKIILIDSAGVKPRFSLVKWLKIRRYKRAKRKGKDLSSYGSSDYKVLGDIMKQTFVRIVNTDQTADLSKIKCPVLLVWGRRDKDTPLYMAKKMKRKIKNSGLVIFENAGHYSYIDCHNQFLAVAESFLKS